MANTILIKNGTLINECQQIKSDIYIKNGIIHTIGACPDANPDTIIDAAGKWIFPGVIDDQVHFREPGLTHKGTIYTEAKSGVAGGVTSFMEMPNTNPTTTTQVLLADKYTIAANTSLANYSFFMGATNSNIDEVLKTNAREVCGIKIFMGSSTGDMLVDQEETLDGIFSKVKMLIATHCEYDPLVKENMAAFKEKYGDAILPKHHPLIRSEEACYKSSSFAVGLAKKYNTKLHILHISTAKELSLFGNTLPLAEKRITAEACIHHLWFSDADYETKGNFIKWNPAVKTAHDRDEIFKAVLDGRIDVIATDHAPHTIEEKEQSYMAAPSGGPLLQHSLTAMIDLYYQGKISLEKIVEKMCHNPAILFEIEKRGYLREGYHADIAIVAPNQAWTVDRSNVLSKCGWSPFEGHTFKSQVTHTIVSGNLVFSDGKFDESKKGQRLLFER